MKRSQQCWFVFSDDLPEGDLPEGEVAVPVKTSQGLAIVCRRGEMTQRMLDRLNEASQHVIGVGLVTINDNGKPPESPESEADRKE